MKGSAGVFGKQAGSVQFDCSRGLNFINFQCSLKWLSGF